MEYYYFNKFFLPFSLFFLLLNGDLLSSEVDNFTRRSEFLKDSTEKINFMANQFLKERVQKLNKKSHNCNERTLYRGLKKDFNILLKGSKFLRAIEKDKKIAKLKIKVRESVYRDWSFMDSPAIRGFKPGYTVCFW